MNNAPHYVIGLVGAAGSGKSTVASRIAERIHMLNRSIPVARMKFASPLRECLRVLGVEKGDAEEENAHPLFREAAQHVGQFFRDRKAIPW